MKFPKDAPQRKVLKTLESLGFKTVRREITSQWNGKMPMELRHP